MARSRYDAGERRVTELYVKAADQLGSDKAPVRLAGLYALERLAQDNPSQRQTIVNVICAYLRMPHTPPRQGAKVRPTARHSGTMPGRPVRPVHAKVGPDPLEELQVRLTAQRVLTDHLRLADDITETQAARLAPDPIRTFWPNIGLDLTGATLVDFDMARCRPTRAAFDDATFTGDARFGGATFTGHARFGGATFTGDAWFVGATFTDGAWFGGATFTGSAWFDTATFTGIAWFGGATFTGIARFDTATFTGIALFGEATFTGIARFDGATFTGSAEFDGARLLAYVPGRIPAMPPGWVLQPDPDHPSTARFERTEPSSTTDPEIPAPESDARTDRTQAPAPTLPESAIDGPSAG